MFKSIFNFFKRTPPLEQIKTSIENSGIADKYFTRAESWNWQDNAQTQLYATNSAVRTKSIEPWPQLIFIAADGQSTIREFVNVMLKKYPASSNFPKSLGDSVIEAFRVLENHKLLILSDASGNLKPQRE